MALPAELKAHHKKLQVCTTRPSYREGRDPKAVKVYTVNQESKYLLVQGVPALGAQQELVKQFALYGTILEYHLLSEYPAEEYTEVYLIKFQNIQSARVAKKKLDDTNFYGGCLHICYAPEFESLEDVREKLTQRRKSVARRLRELEKEKLEDKTLGSSFLLAASTEEILEETQDHIKPGNTQTFSASTSTVTGSSSMSEEPSPSTSARFPHLPLPPVENWLPPVHPHGPRPWFPHHPNANFHPRNPPFGHYRARPPMLPLPPYRPMAPPHAVAPPPGSDAHGIPRYTQCGLTQNGPHEDLEVTRNTVNGDSTSGHSNSHTLQNNSSSEIIVREHPQKSHSKFVPRQVKQRQKPKPLPEVCLEPPKAKVSESMNERLKRKALELREEEAGPNLPEEQEVVRKARKMDSMDHSVDKTVAEIRKQVIQFSAKAVPPQVKKRKQDAG